METFFALLALPAALAVFAVIGVTVAGILFAGYQVLILNRPAWWDRR